MEKELYNDSLETLEDALDSLIKQGILENIFQSTISKVCTKKKDGFTECDIYPFLAKNPNVAKNTLIDIVKIVYGEEAYKHESIVNLIHGASKNLSVPIMVNSNEDLVELFIKAGNILNNQFISMNERKAYGALMKGVQTGIAKSAIILDKRKLKVKLCIDTLSDIVKKIKKNVLIEVKNEDEFYRYLDEIVYVIDKEDQLFSELIKLFIASFNEELKKEELDKKILKYYTKIEKTCNGNLKNIYKVMPKYTDSEFFTYMDGIEKLFDEKNPECTPEASAFLGLHRYGKIQADLKEGKSIN